MHTRGAYVCLLALALLVLSGPHAAAFTVDPVKVADLNTPIPSGVGNFTEFSSFPVVSDGAVTFSGGGNGGQAGVYLFSGGTLSRVADTFTPIPSGAGTFTVPFGDPAVSQGNVAFKGRGSNGQLGNYLFSGGTLSRVVDKATAIPSGGGMLFTDFTDPVISGSNVALQGQGSGGLAGIYLFSGGVLSRVADTNTSIPGGSGTFTFLAPPVISGSNVAFFGTGSLGQGIYLFSGGALSRIADTSTAIPNGSGTFTTFNNVIAISGGNLAFQASGTSQDGIYLFSGGALSRIADKNTPIPAGAANFDLFNPPVISGSNVAFIGGTVPAQGTYLHNGVSLSRVADTSTPIPGGVGQFNAFFSPPAINGSGAFLAFGSAGQEGIYGFTGSLSLGRVADKSTPIPSGVGTFTDFSTPDISGGAVTFRGAGGAGQDGIYLTTASSRLWVGLKNSDDIGTAFDLRAELYKNTTLIASGLSRCIKGLVRNPAGAREVGVAFEGLDSIPVATGDVISLKVLTRIGTKPGNARCSGPGASHASAVGLRLYYDAASRPSRFGATLNGSSTDLFLHSSGTPCVSANVTMRFLDGVSPASTQARCADSAVVKFGGGNPWVPIGTWSTAPQP